MMQQVECDHCGRTLEFSGDRPRFCGFCGQSLSTYLEPEETLDVKPGSSTGSESRKSGGSHLIRSNRESENLVGKTLGEFRILREIGRGGMGVVYEAEQLASSRHVAIKLLSPSISHTKAATERFLREGKLAASLSHPRTTFVYDAGELDERFYIAMELMPGETLRDAIESDGPPSVEHAVDWIMDVLDGLEAAHRAGIVHRDVKPSNCFLDADGHVKVGDFGLSKSLVGDVELTTGGGFMGTPLYAAPEQLRGEDVTAKTDQYSLGATLFYLLCGQPPFAGDFATVIARIVSDPAPAARSFRGEIPADLSKIVARMLEKDPARRFNSLHEVRTALAPFGSGGTSIATLGRRLAAFSLDYLGSSFVASIIAGGIGVAAIVWLAINSQQLAVSLTAFVQAGTAIGVFGYFMFFEAIWGRGLGKKLMGLRTVSLSGERVGFLKAFVRCLFYPLIFLVFQSLAALVTVSGNPSAELSTRESALATIQGTLISVAGWLVCLLGLVTMRSRNGYRGLHGILSGTRVMSVQARRQGVTIGKLQPDTLPPAPKDLQIAGFELQRIVAERDGFRVYQGQDVGLERPVWVYVASTEDGNKLLESLPVHASRPTREQWLRGGRSSGFRWQAFEAVNAVPLSWALRKQSKEFRWGFRRTLLLELAEELRTAARDNSLPEHLSVEQVLVDEHGRLKLINLPVFDETAPSPNPKTEQQNNISRALDLLRDAFQLSRNDDIIPLGDQALHARLGTCEPKEESLDWAINSLRSAIKTPSRLRWDHRLGLLCISMFTEFSVYTTLIGLVAAAPLLMPEAPLALTLVIPCAALALMPIALGAFLNGGPVFRFARVDVLNKKDGRPSSPLRCAWRSFIAWFPLLAALSAFIYVGLVFGSIQVSSSGTSNQGQFSVILVLLLAILILVLFVAGLIVALVNPRRGIQDLLAGTILMPK